MVSYVASYTRTLKQTFEVVKEYRRKGIARKMIKTVLDKVPNSNIFLETSFGQSDAIKFYESVGFVSNEIRKKYLIDWPVFLKHLLDFSYIQFFKRRADITVK